ncbi:M20 family metallopeptidase [Pseudosporangium ferrugineum]|uniref:Succinyl-diaminopimelate desuccinylase n=1 Tax=Pseudosporangium ferrugineum TaxID=439699 RepID=A0A2T0RKJ1_9ACTN|nr:M20/M25/M40 family metallo-hydrolase [Pseudosporangium ferrugineum]PRY21633.1 succinyl-diaminopimelate desuccinylase [Pseudosporangium ferrugineum]
MEELLAAAVRLIAIRSTADRPGQLAEALDLVLARVGPGFTVERFSSRGKPSALVYAGSTRPHFRVILNAHLDVVPAPDGQFRPEIRDGRLYGRGAQDMKVAALVMADVFRELAPLMPYAMGLQLVTDEEVGGHDGTAHQLERGVTAGFVVIGEQSNLRVVTESRGILQVRLHATGTAAHAAYPWLGDNALLHLLAAIDRILARHPVPEREVWATTVNVARIATPDAAINQVPAAATAWLDIRFPPEDRAYAGRTAGEIARDLRDLSGAEVTVDSLGPPHRADPGSGDVLSLQAAAREAGRPGDLLRKHGAADGRFYSARSMDAVIFGPGGDGQHGPGEYADLSTVGPYRAALVAFLRGLR